LKLLHLDFGLVLRPPIESTRETGNLGTGPSFAGLPAWRSAPVFSFSKQRMAPPFERSHVCDFNFQQFSPPNWIAGASVATSYTLIQIQPQKQNVLIQFAKPSRKRAADTGHGVYEMDRAFV